MKMKTHLEKNHCIHCLLSISFVLQYSGLTKYNDYKVKALVAHLCRGAMVWKLLSKERAMRELE